MPIIVLFDSFGAICIRTDGGGGVEGGIQRHFLTVPMSI